MEFNPEVTQRLSTLEQGHQDLKKQITANTELTQQIKNDTASIVEFFKNMNGFIQIMNAVGLFLKWAVIVGGAASALWYAATHGGKFPGA